MHARFHHRQAFHRRMQILAALAIALLVLAPLVSRAVLYPVTAAPPHSAGAHAGHHMPMEGMVMEDMPMKGMPMHGPHEAHLHGHLHDAAASPAAPAAPSPDPHAGHDMGVDCDYCAIAARMTTLVLAALWLLVVGIPPRRALPGLARTHASPPPHAYAARGPPVRAA